MINKTLLIALLFVLFPLLIKADGLDQAGDLFLPVLIIAANIPTFIAIILLIVLGYNNKYGWALIINTLIWLALTGDIILGLIQGINQNLFDPIGILFWLPLTIVFILTLFFYFLSRNKNYK